MISPLHFVAGLGDTNAVEEMLNAGADVNAQVEMSLAEINAYVMTTVRIRMGTLQPILPLVT